MKPRISSLPQARQRIIELRDSVNDIVDFLDGLSATLGISGSNEPNDVPHSATNGEVPSSMSERVTKIITDAKKPLMPKDVVRHYQQLDWPAPDGGRAKLYEAISGTIAYLHNRKGVLKKSAKGYSIKEGEKE